jgi:hypothetical protein
VGVTDRHQTGLLEALVMLDKASRWTLTGRWELEHIDKNSASPEEDHQLEALNLGFYVNPNAKVALDWTHLGDNIGGDKLDQLQVYAHIGYWAASDSQVADVFR